MMSPRLRFHRTQGQSVVIVALAIVVLVAVAGLGLDGANAFNQRRNAANAADAAAVAGANALITEQKQSPIGANSAASVYNIVATYLDKHGIDPNNANNPWTAYYVDGSGSRLGTVPSSGSVSTSAKGVSVDVRTTFDTYFMGVLGRSQLTVGNSGTAIFGAHKVSGADILPITLSKTAADAMKSSSGTIYAFNGDSGNAIGPGNFGAVSLDPNHNLPNGGGNMSDCLTPVNEPDNLSYYWCNGTTHDVETGDWLYGDPGEMANNLDGQIQHRIDTNPIGLIPIYDTYNNISGNNAQFHIVGFMVVQLTSQCLSGHGCNPKTVSAMYQDYVVSTGAIDPNAPVTGYYAINLIKTPGTLQ